ncbi:MAG: sensor histidine kinase [Prevotella sp.]
METVEQLKEELNKLHEQLRQQEKLASLGLLTAGIVHEIRNPLNFVINFSKLSDTLLNDLGEDLEDNIDKLPEDDADDINDIMDDLRENLAKIKEHGERATSIIQNILQYSRGKADDRMPTDIAALSHEYVWLAYHAMRANYNGFNVTIEEDYKPNVPMTVVVPQDISRALLNVVNNAFYAVWERTGKESEDYRPTVTVSIDADDTDITIAVSDNGTGMSEDVKRKLFENFFTTKPIGHGTGLGMSITRDIIVGKHGGSVTFDSTENVGTTFTLTLPISKK